MHSSVSYQSSRVSIHCDFGDRFHSAQIVFAEDANPYIFVNLQQDEIFSAAGWKAVVLNIKVFEMFPNRPHLLNHHGNGS
jgi:hypothetical protein